MTNIGKQSAERCGAQVQDRCTAVLLAAGTGLRMHSDTYKQQYIRLRGIPLFVYAARTMEKSSVITDIVVVTLAGEEENVLEILRRFGVEKKVRRAVAGGAERHLSVWNGLQAIDWPCDYVFVHDSARPLLDEPTLVRLYEKVRECGACVAAVPAKDTIKITDAEGVVVQTPARSCVWIVQTPQVFDRELITKAHALMVEQLEDLTARGIRITDDAMVAELMLGTRVHTVMGSYMNIKVTTPDDLPLTEAFLSQAGEN